MDAANIITDSEVVIATTGLTKKYGSFTAVDNLNLSIRRGEIFGLLGPNGAGKTTTILMLLGLTEPTAGIVRVGSFDPVRDPLAVKSVVGYLPDNVGFYPSMTGRQNLLYTAALNRIPREQAEERITTLLEEVGLPDAGDKKAGTYSRGMRQRLAIADALIKQPSILILDEPTIGIDPEGVRDLLAMLNRLSRDQGMTILLSSHLLHQVQEICDRVGIFVHGHLVAAGPVQELEEKLAAQEELEFTLAVVGQDEREGGAEALARLRAALTSLPGVDSVSSHDSTFTIRGKQDLRLQIARTVIEQGFLPLELHRKGLSLDEIYDSFFREEVNTADVPI